MMDKGYKKLFVWKKADEFAYQIYLTTKNFPKAELYGITSQLRRAALSIPLNIVEGNGRHGKQEKKHFINIALGSLAESEYLLSFCLRIKYLSPDLYNKLESLRQSLGAILWKFYKSF